MKVADAGEISLGNFTSLPSNCVVFAAAEVSSYLGGDLSLGEARSLSEPLTAQGPCFVFLFGTSAGLSKK